MAVTANSMVLPQGIRSPSVVCTGASTVYNATSVQTNTVLLAAAGSNGSYLRGLRAAPAATVTATQLQLFKWNGSNLFVLADSVLMGAYTMAQTTADTLTDFGYTDSNFRYLQSGWTWYVGIGVALAGGILFHAEIEDL